MNKLITALDNKYINEKLKELNKYEINYDDISYQEGIFEILEEEEINILLLSEILKGPYEIKELINKIKEKNNKIEIIMILEKKNENLEKFLIEKNINNYFYNNQLSIKNFVNLEINSSRINTDIDELKSIILKRKYNVENNSENKNFKSKLNNKIENIFLENIGSQNKIKNYFKENKKCVFSFCGRDGLEKSNFILLFSLMLKNKNKKVLNIDFDFFDQNINTLFGVQKFPNKNNLNNKIININKNIDYLSGLEEIINSNYKNIILKINKLKNNYDYILINLSSVTNLKLTKKILELSDYNICIFNNKSKDIIYNNNLLKIYNEEWGINKNKFICYFNNEKIKFNKKALIVCSNLKEHQIKEKLKNNYKFFSNEDSNNNIIFNLDLEKYKLNKNIKKQFNELLNCVKK